jgi:hypothetical protein
MSNKKDFFWASYADLMTSLFFIMLVLFVLAVVMLKKENSKINAKLKEFEKIEEIKKSINSINKKYFEYNEKYKKHVFKVAVNYNSGKFECENLDPAIQTQIVEAGNDIHHLIDSMARINSEIQYLVIIEGQASADGWYYDQYKNNNVLSYLRALYLKNFWESFGIFFDNLENCELVIAGSGEKGVPRIDTSIDFNLEKKNQRFLIHIIPKTGTIDE